MVDPHRPGHELMYYPRFTNLLIADIVVINKVESANQKDVDKVRENNINKYNPKQ